MQILFVLFFFTITRLISGKNVPSKVGPNEMAFIDEVPDFGSLQSRVHEKWPMGNVPYYFNVNSYDQNAAKRIRMVMNKLESSCCIRFMPIIVLPKSNSELTFLAITNPKGVRECVHDTTSARSNGQIPVIIGYDCLDKRNIMHSLLHGLGFQDEVTHSGRDQYVRVLWDNIQPKYQPLFRVSKIQSVGEYDPLSIMHFHDRAYSHNGQATIEPLTAGLLISPSKELSSLDLMKLRVLFGRECNKRKVAELLGTCKDVLASNKKDTFMSPESLSDNGNRNDLSTRDDSDGANSLEEGDDASTKKDDNGEISLEDGDDSAFESASDGASSLEDKVGSGLDDSGGKSSIEDNVSKLVKDKDGGSAEKDGDDTSLLENGGDASAVKDEKEISSLEEGNEVDPVTGENGSSSS